MVFLGKVVEFACTPSGDLRKLEAEGDWEAIGDDPHFLLTPTRSDTFTKGGWLHLEMDFEIADGFGGTRLYWDDGAGYTEKAAYNLAALGQGKAALTLPFPSPVRSLRLDPIDCAGRFRLRGMRVRRMQRHDVFLRLFLRYIWRAALHPTVYAAIAGELYVLWRRQGTAAVKSVIRKLMAGRDGADARDYLRAQNHQGGRRAVPRTRLVRRRAVERNQTVRERIAVGLVEHIGDIIASEPVARYLRRLYPDAEISWVVQEGYRELIDSNPFIDLTVAVDCLTDWIKLVAHESFDRYIDLHVNLRICQCCGVPLHKRAGDPTITGANYLNHGSLLAAFALGAGLPALDGAPALYIPDRVVHAVDALRLPERFVVLHCRSNDTAKDWGADQWRALAAWLVECHAVTVVEVGAQPVLAHPAPHVVNLCGATSLLETAEVIRRAALFVGVDSGPAHMANAVGTQGVVLLGSFGPFKQYNPFTGGYGDGSAATLVRTSAGRTKALDVADVQAAVDARLGNAAPEDAPAAALPAPEPARRDGLFEAPAAPRLIAFYLPQFHPIPENDAHWGKGFTEWANVGKARAMFEGQYQPRLPGEFGYYDLRLPEIMDQQADLARAHGIDGFCYYYYWFQGRRLLHRPIDAMLQRRRPDFPFCFCWANENWTRRWDGQEREILVAQHHTPEDDLRFIRALLPAFDDPRYIRIDGKPLLLVYRTELFPDPAHTSEVWRAEVQKAGIGDLYLVRCEGFDWQTTPGEIGFDAAYEVPTFYLPADLRHDTSDLRLSPEFRGQIFDYDKIVRYYAQRPTPTYKRYKDVMLAWDNTPRHGNRAVVFHNVTPALYAQWLADAVNFTRRNFRPAERVVFINAWNEWAEGSYLEPDARFGRSFLEATREVVASAREAGALVREPAAATLMASAAE